MLRYHTAQCESSQIKTNWKASNLQSTLKILPSMTSADVILIAELLNVHPRQPQWSKLIYFLIYRDRERRARVSVLQPQRKCHCERAASWATELYERLRVKIHQLFVNLQSQSEISAEVPEDLRFEILDLWTLLTTSTEKLMWLYRCLGENGPWLLGSLDLGK